LTRSRPHEKVQADFGGLTSREDAVPETEPWSSVDEVAAHLGASKDTIYRWIEHHGLPATKIGRRWKAKLSEVDAWAKAGGAADRQDDGDGGGGD
jgi:excisionase family DNA binding protein